MPACMRTPDTVCTAQPPASSSNTWLPCKAGGLDGNAGPVGTNTPTLSVVTQASTVGEKIPGTFLGKDGNSKLGLAIV
jgi:hypothetical protein